MNIQRRLFLVILVTIAWPFMSKANDDVEVCFTPPMGCTKVISNAIFEAKESVYVQAYGMSSTVIANALIKAKQKGLVVEIILDKSNLSQNYSQINELKDNGIIVSIDRVPGIAHNKVMIIDKTKVITGSFNFTAAAETRNAENVIIVNDKEIANKYLENWYSRKNKTVNIK